MSRSVTKAAILVSVPLLTLATISLLGTRSAHPGQSRPVAQLTPVVRHLRNGGPDDLVRREAPTPAPTPLPAPAATQPALQAVRPPAPAPAPRPPAPPVSSVGGAAGVEFSLVNQDRAANGVTSLAWSSSLARVAQYRAQDMLSRNYFSHYDPSTGQLAFVELLHLWGIPYSTAGENIAWSTNPSMAGINTMFMNSPEHRANILNGAYHRAGIGVASDGVKTMVVEVFSN